MKIRIGDSKHTEYGGGFPLAGAVQKDFGFEAFLEWRWEYEREQFLNEREAIKKQHEEAKFKKKMAIIGATAILEAYRYTDEKSDEFWTIERQGAALAVGYGKIGTIGKFQVKEYDDEVTCEKRFLKLIGAKRKKGYQPYTKSDNDGRLYFDDEEVGLHPLTSHPKFRAQFTDEFYYDCSDEEAPFGSDEGSDTLAEIEEQLRKKPNFAFKDFPEFIIENIWDMKYIPVDNLDVASIKALIEKDEMNLTQSDMVTVSCAFAQLKITGNINLELKQRAVNSMQRIKIAAHLLDWGRGSEIIDKMIAALTTFV